MIIESALKLIFAVSLVLLGFKVFGAIVGVLLGIFSALIFLFYFNRDILKEKTEKTTFEGIYSQSKPYFISMLVVFLMLSLDIILAKRFFSAELAGQYAVLSFLGKIIFFGTFAISKVMFPLTSEKHDSNKDSSGLFKKSMLIISSLCIVSIAVYALFPELVIGILYGSQYLSVAPYLVYSALALSFLSLSHLVLVYGLSTKRLRKSYLLFLFLIVEIVLLSFFHKNFLEYTLVVMLSNLIMFIGSFFFIRK